MSKTPSLIADLIDLLDADLRYEYDERAGIMEFDANLPRDDAEALALIDLLRTHPDALVGLTVSQVIVDGKTEVILTTDLDAARLHFDSVSVPTVRIGNLAEVIRSQFGGMVLIKSIV